LIRNKAENYTSKRRRWEEQKESLHSKVKVLQRRAKKVEKEAKAKDEEVQKLQGQNAIL